MYVDAGVLCLEARLDEALAAKIREVREYAHWNGERGRWEFNIDDYRTVSTVIGLEIPELELIIGAGADFDLYVEPSITRIDAAGGKKNIPTILLRDACSYEQVGAQYSDAYRAGNWDGKVSLYDVSNRSFPSGLLQTVVQALYIGGYMTSVEMATSAPQRLFEWTFVGTLRPYQADAATAALKYGRGIVQVPTGGGKTVIMCKVIADLGLRTLVLVHTKDLLYQNKAKIEALIGGIEKVGQVGDGIFELGDVTVATVHSISGKVGGMDLSKVSLSEYDEDDVLVVKTEARTDVRTDELLDYLRTVDVVCIDEAHHTPATMTYNVVQSMDAYHRFGLSATPWRDDCKDIMITAAIGDTVYSVNTSKLIEMGYLVAPVIHIARIPPVHFPRSAKFSTVYSKYITNNDTRNKVIAAIARREVSASRQVLILVTKIRHGNILSKQYLPDIENRFLTGGERGTKRKELLHEFARRDYPLLIATTLADEGLDIPTLDTVILAGGGKSTTRTLQRIGRAIRLHDDCPGCGSTNVRILGTTSLCECNDCGKKWIYSGKERAFVYDFIDQAQWLDKQSLRRQEVMSKEPRFTFRRLTVQSDRG